MTAFSPTAPHTWTNSAIEYGVFQALKLHGYSGHEPQCGYSRHPCMVEIPGQTDPDLASFTDFTPINDCSLYLAYIVPAITRLGLTLTRLPGGGAALSNESRYCEANFGRDYRRNTCLVILQWFEVQSVPDDIHGFEAAVNRELDKIA